MKTKKSMMDKIQGWFPQEPNHPIGNVNAKKPKLTIRNGPPTTRERIVGGLGAAGGGLTLMAVVFYFIPVYPKQADAILLIIGVPLLTAAFIVRSTYKKEKTVQ